MGRACSNLRLTPRGGASADGPRMGSAANESLIPWMGTKSLQKNRRKLSYGAHPRYGNRRRCEAQTRKDVPQSTRYVRHEQREIERANIMHRTSSIARKRAAVVEHRVPVEEKGHFAPTRKSNSAIHLHSKSSSITTQTFNCAGIRHSKACSNEMRADSSLKAFRCVP